MTRARTALGLLISGLLLLWFFRAIDPHQVLASLARANYILLVPAILVYFGGVWVRSIRWGMLLSPFGAPPPRRLFQAVVIGFAVNDVTPLRLGEIARAYLLARWERIPVGLSLGTIVVERLFDGLTLCALLAIARLWLPGDGFLATLALVASAAFILGTGVTALATLAPKQVLRLAGYLLRPAPESIRLRVLRVGEAFLNGLGVIRRLRLLIFTSMLSTLAWLSEALMYFMIMLGFGIDAGYLGSLLGMVAANLGTMAPSAPGFLGTFDAPLQKVLEDIFSVERTLATSYTLIVHAALLVPIVSLGGFYLWSEGLTLGRIAARQSDPLIQPRK